MIAGSLVFLLSCEKIEKQIADIRKKRVSGNQGTREDWEKEIAHLEKKIHRCVQDVDKLGLFYRKMADEFAKLENHHQALRYYQLAIEHGETRPEVYHDYAAVQATLAFRSKSAGDHKKAIEFGEKSFVNYNKALLKFPNRSASRFGKSLLQFYILEKKEEAIRELLKMHEEDKKNDRILFALGRMHYESQDYNKALAYYQTILKIVPEKSEKYQDAQKNINQILLTNKKKK